jgi:hypothetical protein
MGITYDNEQFDVVSRSSYGGRKCACCFRFGCVVLVIEMIFTLIASFILAKEFVMVGRHSEILGNDLQIAYIIRDTDMNISINNTINTTYVNTTDGTEPNAQLLSVSDIVIDFTNTTVRKFIEDIVKDSKNTTINIDPRKRYYIQTMEFMYLSVILYCSSIIYVFIMVIFVGYFIRNYVC